MRWHELPRANEWRAILDARLPQKTVEHSFSVADYALFVAQRSDVDAIEAGTAGMLHDLHKATPQSQLIELAEKWDIPISDVQREKPKLLHGPLAAEDCRRNLGITNDAVYEAIWWHTTGTPAMGPVALALYLADFAEPNRLHREAPHARTLFEREGLRAAVRFIAQSKLEYAASKPPVDPNTKAFFEWLNAGEPASRTD